MTISIQRADAGFSHWQELLQLIQDAFAFMEERIDPPSSLHQLTPTSIAQKAQTEALFLAFNNSELVGCVFGEAQENALYVNKLAVAKQCQGRGIGRHLMLAVEQHALEIGKSSLELKARIELTENHRTFEAMGYTITGKHAHPGYDQPTFVAMRKAIGMR